MDFLNVVNWNIPEGNVKKVTCEDKVLWEKEPDILYIIKDGTPQVNLTSYPYISSNSSAPDIFSAPSGRIISYGSGVAYSIDQPPVVLATKNSVLAAAPALPDPGGNRLNGTIFADNPIDLTNYNKILVYGTSGTGGGCLNVTETKENYYNLLGSIDFIGLVGSDFVELDITNLSGKKYIAFGMLGAEYLPTGVNLFNVYLSK